MSENTDKRTASQRIEDLERVLTSVYQATQSLIAEVQGLMPLKGDMPLVKDALKLINKRVEAVVQAAKPESGITQDSVSELLVKLNVQDLTAQVQQYLANGFLTAADTVTDGTFLVCEELNSDGKVVNPRIQFRLDSQDQATQDALKGKMVGDSVSFGDNKLSAHVLEVYTLVQPKAPEAPVDTGNDAPPAGQPENDQALVVAPDAATTAPTVATA